MLKIVSIEELQAGMLVTAVVEQHGPVKIRKVGMIRSLDMLKGLREMGVTKVEVDLAQSLGLDDDPEPAPTARPEKAESTATQRLVASNKRVADVDRQLSQQFHRSLFLPAVEQMPSKWHLYGKPYAMLCACIVVGFIVGFSVFQIPKWFLTQADNEAQSASISKENNQNTANLSASSNDGTPVASGNNEVPNTDVNQNTQVAVQNELDDTLVVDNQPSNNSVANNVTPNTNITSNANDASGQSLANTNETPELVSMNGVLIESGQQVLGYQAPAIEEPDVADLVGSGKVATRSDIASPVTNNELLRRIQEAADEIDNRPLNENPEPVHVTDLNDLPRIDQLAPAVLTQMPGMSFSAHMYATNQLDRWVRVNGRRLSEGDFIANDLQLLRIEPDKVIVSFRGNDFTMNALSDW